MYLSQLDKIFENRPNVFYALYCDDILILTKKKQAFVKAKRQLRDMLKKLKLQYSRRKTKMGLLTKGFHFLGINFSKVNQALSAASTNAQQEVLIVKGAEAQTQSLLQSQVSITLHERCSVLALDKITVMKAGATPVEDVQLYLSRWAAWWCRSAPDVSVSKFECLKRWIQ